MSAEEESGIPRVAVKCVEMWRNTSGEGDSLVCNDAEARKRGERTGLDTLVVHAVNDERYVRGFPPFSAAANALSTPPGSTVARLKLKGIDGARTSGGACGLIRSNAKNLTRS